MARKMGIEVTHFMPELSISVEYVSLCSKLQDKAPYLEELYLPVSPSTAPRRL